MVFAVWAARPGVLTPEIAEAFRASYRSGREHMADIVLSESASRGFAREVVHEYLTHYIVHELGPRDYEGMERFLVRAPPGAHPPCLIRRSLLADHLGSGRQPLCGAHKRLGLSPLNAFQVCARGTNCDQFGATGVSRPFILCRPFRRRATRSRWAGTATPLMHDLCQGRRALGRKGGG